MISIQNLCHLNKLAGAQTSQILLKYFGCREKVQLLGIESGHILHHQRPWIFFKKFIDLISYFFEKTYDVATHWKRLIETLSEHHNECCHVELGKKCHILIEKISLN